MSDDKESSSTSSSSSKPSKPKLAKGVVVNGTWKVVDELGSGGIGVVYSVESMTMKSYYRQHSANEDYQDDENGNEFVDGCPVSEEAESLFEVDAAEIFTAALKVEAIDPKKRYSETLKVEALVLRRMHWSDYVCRIFMAGRLSPSMNVIVMTKMGPSLSSLRRMGPNQRYTLSTAVRIIRQAIEAIEQLHAIGFIHRDIKPSNFAIGLSGEERGKIHLLDFGFAHAYLRWTSQGTLEHKPARPRAPFMGTDRYCSANVHNRNEQGRRDDMWSLFYTLIELMKGKLPWRSLHKTEILACKVRETPFLLDRCPWELYKMYQHIRSLDYTSRPDYALMRKVIDDVCERRGFRLDDPLDWQEGGRLCKNNPKLLQ